MLAAAAAAAVLLCAHAVLPDAHSAEAIEGTRQACANEGAVVPARLIAIQDIDCFTCTCQNGFVECKRTVQCPSMEGCYMKLNAPQGGCCKEVCKGCVFEGAARASGEEWRDPADACRVLRCEGGVVTEAALQCYAPCHDPSPPAPGRCCPTCAGCLVDGRAAGDGRNVSVPEDPCLECRCEGGGRVACEKRPCPVLHCPESARRPPAPGRCCPSCAGQRRSMEPPGGACLLGREVRRAGEAWAPDACTLCRCANGTALCRRQTCAVLECAAADQHTPRAQCCPQCRPVALRRDAACAIAGRSYKDGESWRVGPCKACLCHRGQVRCAVQMCPACAPGHREERRPGECCQRCVENDGVCAVFGDPHYKTFDGKFFSFQGACKYQLAADCAGRDFSVRVTHDARPGGGSARTKTLSLKMGGVRVSLGRRGRVKVNGRRVQPPLRLGGRVSVRRGGGGDGVRLHTRLGVRVLWDGRGFAEVRVPTAYKGRMCGLCGDFDGRADNDFATRRGRQVHDADKFGASWRVGGQRACGGGGGGRCAQPAPDALRRCEPLKAAPFAACHRRAPFMAYFRACVADMCECPGGRCFCEAFTAYARECQRLGTPLRDWRAATGCAPHRPSPAPAPAPAPSPH